jgi:hypothetical protein
MKQQHKGDRSTPEIVRAVQLIEIDEKLNRRERGSK